MNTADTHIVSFLGNKHESHICVAKDLPRVPIVKFRTRLRVGEIVKFRTRLRVGEYEVSEQKISREGEVHPDQG